MPAFSNVPFVQHVHNYYMAKVRDITFVYGMVDLVEVKDICLLMDNTNGTLIVGL